MNEPKTLVETEAPPDHGFHLSPQDPPDPQAHGPFAAIRRVLPGAEVIRFLAVGVFNTAFSLVLYSGCVIAFGHLLPSHGKPLIAEISFIISTPICITVAFLCYKHFVFRTKGNYLKEWLRCFAVYSVSFPMGLVILPTHRVVHSLEGFDPEKFRARAAEFFAVEPLPAADAQSYIATLKSQKGTAFVAVTKAGATLLQAKPEAMAAALAAGPDRQRQLDLTQLHSIILDRLLGLDAEKVREQTNLRYLRDAGEAVEQVRSGEADVVFLTNPVTMEQLREVAFAGEVMPQKSTDFFPKLLSGLTIYALD